MQCSFGLLEKAHYRFTDRTLPTFPFYSNYPTFSKLFLVGMKSGKLPDFIDFSRSGIGNTISDPNLLDTHPYGIAFGSVRLPLKGRFGSAAA